MGKAEFGTPKYIANRMKSRGLQKLKWFCQVCEKQCRDENGYKCHAQSESHQRQMLLVGENARKHIGQYSRDFQTDFLAQLRMSHGEKRVNANRFYNEYIQNKEHVHMNATQWASLSAFVKHLADKKICHVEETDKEGLTIAYIDNSAASLERKQMAAKKSGAGDTAAAERKRIEAEVQKAKENGVVEEEVKEAVLTKTDAPIQLSLSLKKTADSQADKPKVKKNPFGAAKSKVSKPKAEKSDKDDVFKKLMVQDMKRR